MMAMTIGGISGVVLGAGLWLCVRIGGGFLHLGLAFALGIALSAVAAYLIIMPRARAVDGATQRLLGAAQGDLQSGVAPLIRRQIPHLAAAMENLFSQTRSSFDNVETMAMHDPVTGLANRVSFCRQVERLLMDQDMQSRAAMFFIDLDGFKAVNDTLGHAAGDQILMRVAGRLREVVMLQARQTGNMDAVVGRLAGDEFTLFFPSLPQEGMAMRIARAVQYALDEPFDINGVQTEIGASIGVAYYPDHGATLSALLRAADHAMYEAKSSGRGRVQLYSRDLEQRITGRMELEKDLRRGLARDEFLLEFQPQIDISSGRVIGAEALVRWQRPDGERIQPAVFVRIAEETGLIVELGDWILNRVCETAARWDTLGIRQRLGINLSRRELLQPDFFLRLSRAMERHATPPTMLELELSETLVMDLDEEMCEALLRLRQFGIHIVIDDFGTGHSHLGQLRTRPIDRVKIDRSLARDIATSGEARTVCSALVALVKGMGRAVSIEGVETQEQLEMLRIMGCTTCQGFLFSPPIDEAAYLQRFGQTELETAVIRTCN